MPVGLPVRPGVTAVLVSHDGARWLPEVLAALAAQTVPPDRVVCTDTGSHDDSAQLLGAAHGAVVHLPRTTGYGEAVAAALAAGPRTPWVWLLHDDCAPDPGALEALLAGAADSPSAAVLGPKAVDWDDPRRLVEVGLTTDAAGHRVTGLERGEHDQGQHDAVRDVLAVGTAGALVRRDVWDALGGLDATLPVFRDDLDLGWRANAAGHRVVVVPQARVRHVRAATTGRRALDAVPGRPGTVDRRHALLVLLAHAAGWRLLPAVPRLVVGGLLRALVLLLTRQPLAARDELSALGILTRPRRLHRARRARAATRTVPPSVVRPLLASRRAQLRARLGALGDWASGGGAPLASAPVDAGTDELPPPAAGGRLLLRPGVLVVVATALVAVVAERALLAGGPLHGGRLLTAPDGARDLWSAYAQHGGQPRLAVLGALASVLLGRAPTAVGLLLLASVPAAAATAWAAAGRVVRTPLLRGWAAATWALLPVAAGAVAAGRLDAAVVQVALPVLLLGGWSVLHRDPRTDGWWRAWALGLGLAAVTAFAPQLWPVAAVLLVGTALVVLASTGSRRRAARRLLATVIAVTAPVLVLQPWTWLDGADLLHGPGVLAPGLAERDLPAWQLLLLHPGGPGTGPRLLAVGLVLGALGGLLRTGRPRLAAAGWALALVGLAHALVLARTGSAGQPVWPGTGLQVAAAGLLLAALVGADGLQERLARASFGWRQLGAVLVVAATAAVPVLCALTWIARGADGPLHPGGPAALPAFVEAELAGSGERALLLDARSDGTVGYALSAAPGPRLGDPRQDDDGLDGVVADLLSPRGSDAAAALATRAVRWVATADGDLAAALDVQDGLVRQSGDTPLLWRVAAAGGRVQLLPPGAARAATAGARSAPGGTPVDGTVGRGDPGRLLVLAEPADGTWHAEVDGEELPARTAWGWASAFELPATGGAVTTRRDGDTGRVALQGISLLVVAVLAAPGRRRRHGLER